MAYTYEYIASSILSTNTATITFSSIPSTYTDLELRIMAKGNNSGDGTFNHMVFSVNNSSAAMYNSVHTRGDAGASNNQSASKATNITYGLASYIDGPTAPADAFGASSIYFFNYAGPAYKPFRWHSANEYNVSPRYTNWGGGVINTNTAISSIEIRSDQFTITSYQAGSQFYLYGIKNS